MRLLLSLIAVFAFCFTPAFAAEKESASGMRTIYNTPGQAKTEEKPGMRTLNYVRTPAQPPGKEEKAKSDSEIVWEKYKALAAGQPERSEEPEKTGEPKTEETEKAETPPPEAAPATGFAAILSDYRKNKTERARMRTLSVSKESDLPAQRRETP